MQNINGSAAIPIPSKVHIIDNGIRVASSASDIDSGLTANSHVEAHAKGGSKMVVGNAKANLKSKTDTIYSAV